MMQPGLAILAILAAILSFTSLTTALKSNFPEKPKAYFVPHVRAKRTPDFSITASGSNEGLAISQGLSEVIWKDDKSVIEASEGFQSSWAFGAPLPRASVSLGATYTRNLFNNDKGTLDLRAGYGKGWSSDGRSSGSLSAELSYRAMF